MEQREEKETQKQRSERVGKLVAAKISALVAESEKVENKQG